MDKTVIKGGGTYVVFVVANSVKIHDLTFDGPMGGCIVTYPFFNPDPNGRVEGFESLSTLQVGFVYKEQRFEN